MVLPASLSGQTADQQFGSGVAALQRGEYEEAERIFSHVINVFKASAGESYGARFGVIYYHRGIANMQMENYTAAAADFMTCYDDYPNVRGNENVNPYHTASLLQAGGVYMRLENYEKAIEILQKFEETMAADPIDKDRVTYNRGALWANLTTALTKTGKPELAHQYFTKIVTDDREPDRETRSTFTLMPHVPQDLAIEIIALYAEDENGAAKVDAFLGEHEQVLQRDPALRFRHAARYILLGREYGSEENYALARRLYAMVPTPTEVREDLRFKKFHVDTQPDSAGNPSVFAGILERIETNLEENLAGPTPLEGYLLDGMARIFQENGNFRANFAAYSYLVETYPQAELRPNFLHATVHAASIIGQLGDVDKYAAMFLDEFPEHELAEPVEALWMEGMFLNGDYENALRVAQARLPQIAEGTTQRDLAEHIIGASLYYLEEYMEAEEWLRNHVRLYPESSYKESAKFIKADNLFRLDRFTEAGRLLDEFIKDFPESVLMDQALYTRADIHFNLDQLNQAVGVLNRFFADYPHSALGARGRNLFGNVYEALGQDENASEQYKLALARAKSLNDIDVLTDSKVFLIALHNEDEEKTEEVIGYYERFFENYPDHPNKPRIAVGAMPALERADRMQDGLDRLETLIEEYFGHNPEAYGLDDTIITYAEYLRKSGMSLEEMRVKFYDPPVSADALVVRARMRMTLIDVHEDEMKAEDEGSARHAELAGRVDALFTELNEDFAPEDLSNYILVRIGENMRRSGRYDQAERYLGEILNRQNPAFREDALYALAQIGVESGEPERLQAAVGALERILDDYSADRALAERSTRLLALSYEGLGEYEKVNETWRKYLQNQAWRTYSAEAYFRMGKAYEQRQMWGDALANYSQIIALHVAFIEYSAPGWLRLAEIQFDELGEKQKGYEALKGLVDALGHLEEDDPTGAIAEAKGKLRDWERAPGVTPIR